MIKLISVYARNMELKIDYNKYESIDDVLKEFDLSDDEESCLRSGDTINIGDDELFAIRVVGE